MVSHAQTHVRKAIDNMLSEHPEWVINSGKSESAIKSGTQSNRIYELSITDLTAIDSLLSAFDADKMDAYSYIRTSAAYNQAITKYWGGKKPNISETSEAYPLRDGNGKDDDAYQDHVYINAKTGKKPSVTDKSGQPIIDEDEIYSGVWAWVCITFYGYKVNGKCGIAAALEAVRKCKDDEQFGGSISQAEAFGNIPMDDEDDDDL